MRATCLLVLAVLAAGCAGPASLDAPPGAVEPPESDSIYEAVRQAMEGAPCQVSSIPRSATSANLRTLGSSPLSEQGPVATRGEADHFGPWLVVAFYNHEGFTLVNATDPMDPQVESVWLANEGGTTYDVKFTRDGTHVVLGFKDRVSLVDVSDPGAPRHVQTLEHPASYAGQAHMVVPAWIGGHEYLFITPSISGTGVLVHRLVGNGTDRSLEHVTVYPSAQPHALYPQAMAPHDAYVTFEGDVNHTVLWLANGFSGLLVLNVDDPMHPETLASVPPATTPDAVAPLPTHYHSVQVAWVDGKRLLATSSEVGYNTLKLYDATDLANIRFLADWIFDPTNPAALQHNLQIVNATLVMAHYEHGLFAFDLHAVAQRPSVPLAPSGHWQPASGGLIWDVVVSRGLLYLTDIPQGMHVLGFGCFEPNRHDLTSDG